MSTITIRTTDEEKELMQEYAKFNGLSLSEFIKKSMVEMIENEYDYRIGEKAYREYVASGEKATPVADFLAEIENGQ